MTPFSMAYRSCFPPPGTTPGVLGKPTQEGRNDTGMSTPTYCRLRVHLIWWGARGCPSRTIGDSTDGLIHDLSKISSQYSRPASVAATQLFPHDQHTSSSYLSTPRGSHLIVFRHHKATDLIHSMRRTHHQPNKGCSTCQITKRDIFRLCSTVCMFLLSDC